MVIIRYNPYKNHKNTRSILAPNNRTLDFMNEKNIDTMIDMIIIGVDLLKNSKRLILILLLHKGP